MNGAKIVSRKNTDITWYRCRDCGLIRGACDKNAMRPNNKFCDRNCMAYVIENGLSEAEKRPRGWKKWIIKFDTINAADSAINTVANMDTDELNDELDKCKNGVIARANPRFCK